MIKVIKRFCLIFILSLVFLSIFACKYFDRGSRAPHICSYDDVNVIAQVSCTTDGVTETRCICGLTTVDVSPAYGHPFGQWQIAVRQTCSQYGKATRTCGECGFIQEQVIDKAKHTYNATKEKIDGRDYNRYTCNQCDESFLLDAGITIPSRDVNDKYLFDCNENFSFVIISANGEEYIKNELKIFDCRFDYVGNENDGLFPYKLTSLGNDRWRVQPEGVFEGGVTYRVEHSDGIYFENYGFAELYFSVNRDESETISLSNSIIYLSALENESPGYYPYSIERSVESGDYLLSLEKADGLSVGNIICIGSATCFEDVVIGNGNNTFGKIRYITTLNDGRFMIIIQELTAKELFSALDIYDHSIKNAEELILPLNVEDRLKTILFDNEDFASLISAMYTESLEHLEIRGLSTSFKDFNEYLESIKILRESEGISIKESDNGRSYVTTSITLKAVIEIPVLFGAEKEKIGSLMAELSIIVDFEALSLGLQLNEDEENSANGKGGLNLSFDVTEKTATELKLDIYSSVEYLAESTPYVFEVDTRKYHFANCSYISKETADKQTTVSVYSMMGVISESPVVNECEFCQPATSMKQDICVLDKNQWVYHNVKCRSCFSTSPTNLVFTEAGSKMLSSMGYTPCDDCGGNSDIIGTFESNMLERIKTRDFGKYSDDVISSVIDSENIKSKLYVGAFSTTLCGIDREITLISVNMNFRLENTTHYSYKIQRERTHGLRSVAKGTMSFESTFVENVAVKGFISPAYGDDLIDFETNISLLIAGFIPKITE